MLANVVSTQEDCAADNGIKLPVTAALGVSAAGDDEAGAGRTLGEQPAAPIKNRNKKVKAFLIIAVSLKSNILFKRIIADFIDDFVDINNDILYNSIEKHPDLLFYARPSLSNEVPMSSNFPSLRSIIDAIVPITRFNRGEASKIFDEVNETGTKIVLKNNVPVGVVISPEQYEAMVETLEDYALFIEAEERIKNSKAGGFISSEQLMKSLGIHETDLKDVEVDIDE